MSGRKALAEPSDCVYQYDGSLAGFYCCVFKSVYSGQLPFAIVPEDEPQQYLQPLRFIETEPDKAERVRASIPKKISRRALQLIETVFLSCLEEKELAMLRFLLLGYAEGKKTTDMLGHPDVDRLLNAERHLLGERHLLLGFIRFSDYDGVLAATISPKNFVLPYLVNHFTARFSGEEFLIYDKTHKAALIFQGGEVEIVPMLSIEFPTVSEGEAGYRSLWKQFYNTVAIESRTNPKCRMGHMPKRYWENMLEVQELV